MDHEQYIQIALEEAKKSAWPFGAVVVLDGRIVSQAGSGDHYDSEFDPTAHAEVNAIRRACVKLGRSDLSGAAVYATCEPCALCIGAAWYANIKEIFFGTSLAEISEFSKNWEGDLAFPHEYWEETGISMHGGILRDQIMAMFAEHPRVKNR